MVGGDVSHAPHVGGERVDTVDTRCRARRVLGLAQIREDEFVGITGGEFRLLYVDAANLVTLLLQERHQMVTDESTGARH